jgi:phosphoribosylformylglycinamidine synthase
VAPNVGDLFVLMGGRTGRDGIHGVTFASEELTNRSEIEDRPAVQIGSPFTKKQVMEATFEALEKVDVQGLKDLGGGGLTCCVSEMAAKGNNGAEVELTKIPLREEGMTPYEIMLSESQERMVFVVHPDHVDDLIEIFNKYELPSSVIGHVTDTGQMVVNELGETIADLPTELLSDPPVIEREARKPTIEEKYVDIQDVSAEKALLGLLSSPNIASKEWVYKQYDHEVQVRSVVKPGDDAAVLRINSKKAFALTTDCNSIQCYLDPYHGGAGAVAEAIRNVVAMGAEPLCMVDCLNFGNPEKPEVFWQFRECVKGMADLARQFNLPVTSGNVSFYNETEGVTVNPSPVVSVAGVMDIENIRTTPFKNDGDDIILIGETLAELDGSEYHKTLHRVVQGTPPRVSLLNEYQSAWAVLKMIRSDQKNLITAVHDLSAGGLAVALAEMIISGGIGASVDLDKIPVKDDLSNMELLFSETNARYLITVNENYSETVLNKLKELKVPAEIIGKTGGDKFIINESVLKISVEDLNKAYAGVIEKFMV